MKNREYYYDEIMNANKSTFCREFIKEKVLNEIGLNCDFMDCSYCQLRLAIWLDEEHEEEPVDWSKVEVDTKVLVSGDGKRWIKGYFAKYENGKCYAWNQQRTSWVADEESYCNWNYMKLAEKE